MRLSAKKKTYSLYRFGGRLTVAAATAAGVLFGCGGGGGSSDGTATTVPEEKAVALPITEMPTSSYSGFKQEAFERLNEARIAAGVSAVRQNAQLDAAAQAHAEYLAGNYVTGHYEDVNKPLFTGYSHADRAAAQGYTNRVRSEIITYFYGPATGKDHMNFHLNSVYHLAAALDASANEVGIGDPRANLHSNYVPSSFTFGTTDSRLRAVNAVWVWPSINATDVPSRFHPAAENPNPMPDLAPDKNMTVGTPIMFCTHDDSTNPLEITKVGFVEVGASEPPKARILHHSSVKMHEQPGLEIKADPNLNDLRNSQCIFLVPLSELKTSTTYTVDVEASRGNQRFTQRWSFSTAS